MWRIPLLTIFLALLFALQSGGAVNAASFTVTKVEDTNDGVCDTDCSLREAIIDANGSPGSTVTIPNLGNNPDVFYLSGEIGIAVNMTIVGAGEAVTVLDGDPLNGENRAFNITDGVVAISDLTIRNGAIELEAPDNGEGGAIRVALGASLTLADALFKDNSAERAGGAVYNAGTLTARDSVFDGNKATGEGVPGAIGGGAIDNDGALDVLGSTFTSNEAGQSFPLVAGFGGAIHNRKGATATINSSWFESNQANGGYGGGISTAGTLTVSGSTFKTNSAATPEGDLGEGGGIETTAASGLVWINDSTFDDNAAGIGRGFRDQGSVSVLQNVTVINHDGAGVFFESGGADLILDSTITNNSIGVLARGSPVGEGVTIINSTITGNTYALDAGNTSYYGFINVSDSTLAANGTICNRHIWTEESTAPRPEGEPALRINDLGGNDVPNSDGDLAFDPCDNCPNVTNAGQENDDGDQWGDACDNCPDTATLWFVPVGDSDCDSFTDTVETFVGTDPTDSCANTAAANDETDDRWPADTDDNQFVNSFDVTPFSEALNSVAPGPPYTVRLDLNMDGTITVFDVVALIPLLNKACLP